MAKSTTVASAKHPVRTSATAGTTNTTSCTNTSSITIPRLRRILVAALVVSAVVVAVSIFAYISGRERDAFESQLQSDAAKLLTGVGRNWKMTMSAADSFMYQVVYQSRSQVVFSNTACIDTINNSNATSTSTTTWPLVTIPGLAVQAAKIISQTNSFYMAFYPKIEKDQRARWENFTRDNDAWVEESLAIQARNPNFQGPILTNYSKSKTIWRNEGPEDDDADGPFLPSWMGSPVIPTYFPYNWNGLAYPAFAKALLHSMSTKSVVLAAVSNHADPNDPAAVSQAQITSHWAKAYISQDKDPNEPISDMYYPVLDDSYDDVHIDTTKNTSALGVVAFTFYWRDMLNDILPSESKGLVLVFQTPCNNQYFTYEVNGKTPTFLGLKDLHEPGFDDRAESALLSELANQHRDSQSYSGVPMSSDFCPWTVTVYPSSLMQQSYMTNTPLLFALGSAMIFIFVALVFAIYDLLVRREFNHKQQLLEAKRHFMRFVSHEVRTPLNGVCLGLSLLQDEIASAVDATIKARGESTSHSPATAAGDNSNGLLSTQQMEEWMDLTREICDSAEASVDVLNDLLNYDKIQMGSFSMELSVMRIWKLVEETSREFRLSARQKNIQFALENRLLAGIGSNDESTDLEDPETSLAALRVVGDHIRLAQLLRNLVSNSVKFTSEGGSLTIRVSWNQTQKQEHQLVDVYILKSGEEVGLPRQGTAVIEVIDNGAGMSEEELKALFQDGAQFNVNKLQAGNGSGLGLFISKGMAEQHRGTLEATSPGHGLGSTFTLELPMYQVLNHKVMNISEKQEPVRLSSSTTEEAPLTNGKEEPVRLTPSSPEEASLANEPQLLLLGVEPEVGAHTVGPASTDRITVPQSTAFPSKSPIITSLRILVVDDVASNRKLLTRMARNKQHQVEAAEDGREAVEMVQLAMDAGNPFHTILMDYEMPRLRGPDAVVEIRALGCQSFIVGVTGNVLDEDVNHFLSCGADSVLAKPIKFKKLEELWIANCITEGNVARCVQK